jgi:hypothetical protein
MSLLQRLARLASFVSTLDRQYKKTKILCCLIRQYETMSSPEQAIPFSIPARHHSLQAQVRWGDHVVTVGGDAPVRVQSMTNTDTVDVIGTAIQVKELAVAGSELVRITVNTPEAAAAVPHIRDQLDRMGIEVPLVGDFHYNGHRLLSEHPACAEALSVPYSLTALWYMSSKVSFIFILHCYLGVVFNIFSMRYAVEFFNFFNRLRKSRSAFGVYI